MNKIAYISVFILGVGSIILSGCQKTEFVEVMQEAEYQLEQKQTEDNTSNGNDEMKAIGETDRQPVVIPVPKSDDLINGMVKEVSDGDEESDDDENTTD